MGRSVLSKKDRASQPIKVKPSQHKKFFFIRKKEGCSSTQLFDRMIEAYESGRPQ